VVIKAGATSRKISITTRKSPEGLAPGLMDMLWVCLVRAGFAVSRFCGAARLGAAGFAGTTAEGDAGGDEGECEYFFHDVVALLEMGHCPCEPIMLCSAGIWQ